MRPNLQLSFDFGNYNQRSNASHDHFVESYEHIFEDFVKQCEFAFREMSEFIRQMPPSEVEPRLRAVMLNGMVCGKMMKLYPDTCMRRDYSRASFLIDGLETFIKKLDDNLLPSNAISKHNLALRAQLAPPNEDRHAVLWMGYTIDEQWRRITGFYVANIIDDRVLWYIDIEEYLSSRNATLTAPRLPVNPIDAVKPGLKKAAEEEKVGEK